MTEITEGPVLIYVDKQKLLERARTWMIEQEGTPRDLPHEARERFYTNLGLLIHFIQENLE